MYRVSYNRSANLRPSAARRNGQVYAVAAFTVQHGRRSYLLPV
jgi:hypothetical protein